MGRCVVGEIKMADIYSHYYIFFNMTDLSWVSYNTPLLPAEIRVTINFSTKFQHQKLIPNSGQEQDHLLLLISADYPIISSVSTYISLTLVGPTSRTYIREIIRKSIGEALGEVQEPLSAGTQRLQHCTCEELTQYACDAVFARLGIDKPILGVHHMEMDVEVSAKYHHVVGGCDGPRETSCCICLEDLIPSSSSSSSDQALETLPCWHVFHYNCLLNWRIRSRPLCPLCRQRRGNGFMICV